MQVKISLQLYTLRNEIEKHGFKNTLSEVAAIGYSGVELAGYYGFSSLEMKDILDSLDLKAVSSHVGFNSLADDFENTTNYMKTLGSKYITIPGVHGEMVKDFEATKNTAEKMNEIAKKAASIGISLSYHNHSYEFQDKHNEKTIHDIFFEYAPELHFELDTGWSSAAGINNSEYIPFLAKRLDLVHIKDLDENNNPVEMCTGKVDIPAVFKAIKPLGIEWAIVEQDNMKAYPALESIKISYNNIKKNCL